MEFDTEDQVLYSFNCHIHELFWLIGFFVAFLDINNLAFRKTNSSGKTLDTRQKIFYAARFLIMRPPLMYYRLKTNYFTFFALIR